MFSELAGVDDYFFNTDEDPRVVHRIKTAALSKTPAGSECTNYTATCGRLVLEYSVGDAPYTTKFTKKLAEAESEGASPCPECFPPS